MFHKQESLGELHRLFCFNQLHFDRNGVIKMGRKTEGLIFLLALIILLLPAKGVAGEKISIGEVEDVILIPWGVRLPARIDTGAAVSSLDARDLRVKDGVAEFKLPKRYGSLQFHLPVIGWQNIRSADFKERRPVVEISFCLGAKILHTEINLNDRSTVQYPLILGRNVLKDYFIVDCGRSNCLAPSCPEVRSK
jgi:hypothetical protein